MKLKALALVLICAAVFNGCSILKYKVMYEDSMVLLEECDALNQRAVAIIDSLEMELDVCQMQLRNFEVMSVDSTQR